jgi:riboflavin kinase/FMN adenylyltransferase
MNVAHSIKEIEFQKNTVVTVGTFDGVHRGHQEIVRDVIQRAKSREGRSVIVTFDPHPREVLGNGLVQLLTTAEEREQIFRDLNPNILLVLKFTYEFSRQSFREFYLNYFIRGVGVSEIVEGYDHHFGRDREGSIEELVKLGKEFGFSVVAVNPVSVGGEVVSSSNIRQDISEGNVEHARLLMGRFYSLTGTVVRGDGRGKALGYPTANLVLAHAVKLVPKNGIYFVAVKVGTMIYPGMASIGVRPTFHENGRRTIEVNILGFTGNLYGERLELQFLKRLRDELKFQNVDDLVVQMNNDKEESLKLRLEFSALFH